MKHNISYLLLITHTFAIISMEIISDDNCDAGDSALAQWYSQVYNFVNVNQNTSQHILQLNKNLQNLEDINRNLELCLKDQQRQLNRLEKQIQHVHQNTNGNIVIQRRQDGSVDFYRTWNEYKQGFGEASGEFFIGLDKLHKLTNTRPYELLVVMEDWENDRRYAKYDQFIVGSESENYLLKSLGAYSGSAGDSLREHLGQNFSTKDKDNDATDYDHCAVTYTGAWWYRKCYESNLNGVYLKGYKDSTGIIWRGFKSFLYSLKFVEITLRPK